MSTLAFAAVLGCSGTTQMARWTSQETGCGEEEISISSVQRRNESASYYATCKDGSIYECVSSGRYVDGISTSCEALGGANDDDVPAGPQIAKGEGTYAISQWTGIQFETCPVTAMMPLAPRPAPTELVPGIKSLEFAVSGGEEWTVSVGCTVLDLPEGKTLYDNPEEVFRSAAQRSADNMGGTITSFRATDDWKTAHVVVNLAGQGTVLERMWLTADTVVLALVAPREGFSNTDLSKFFGNVRVGQ